MNATYSIAVFAVVIGIVFVVATRLRNQQLSSEGDFDSRWQQIDLLAFQNLTDHREEQFLRQNLPTQDFRRLQRERLLVMREYLSRLAGNARLMMQAGQIVQHSQDSNSREAAMEFVQQATRLRLLIFAAQASLLVRFLMPLSTDPMQEVVLRYRTLTGIFQSNWANQFLPAQSLAS